MTAENQTATPAQTARARTPAQTSPAQPATSEQAQQPNTRRTADTTATDTPARTELPRTASPLPLFALLGLGSLVGAGALRLRRR